ncbi:dihydrofolate reductase family protein [Frigoribacterium sp. 2-23]|uniref:dihydrofolate reductase family protein n=1 Tax=Frigoribacterium sp. 2-23 TaxID=3415006 RepID=UPI003C6ED465
MRKLTYSINVTLDGCIDHREGTPDAETHHQATEALADADGLVLGRVTYELMEGAWRPPLPQVYPEWMVPFACVIDRIPKYVASTTLERVDWNAELLGGDVVDAVRELKGRAGGGLRLGGSDLATTLASAGLIDEYEFVVHPRVAGHGPYLLAGLHPRLDLELVSRREFESGAVASVYRPRG